MMCERGEGGCISNCMRRLDGIRSDAAAHPGVSLCDCLTDSGSKMLLLIATLQILATGFALALDVAQG